MFRPLPTGARTTQERRPQSTARANSIALSTFDPERRAILEEIWGAAARKPSLAKKAAGTRVNSMVPTYVRPGAKRHSKRFGEPQRGSLTWPKGGRDPGQFNGPNLRSTRSEATLEEILGAAARKPNLAKRRPGPRAIQWPQPTFDPERSDTRRDFGEPQRGSLTWPKGGRDPGQFNGPNLRSTRSEATLEEILGAAARKPNLAKRRPGPRAIRWPQPTFDPERSDTRRDFGEPQRRRSAGGVFFKDPLKKQPNLAKGGRRLGVASSFLGPSPEGGPKKEDATPSPCGTS